MHSQLLTAIFLSLCLGYGVSSIPLKVVPDTPASTCLKTITGATSIRTDIQSEYATASDAALGLRQPAIAARNWDDNAKGTRDTKVSVTVTAGKSSSSNVLSATKSGSDRMRKGTVSQSQNGAPAGVEENVASSPIPSNKSSVDAPTWRHQEARAFTTKYPIPVASTAPKKVRH